MKTFLTLVVLIQLAFLSSAGYYIYETDCGAERWRANVTESEQILSLANEIEHAQAYSYRCFDAVCMLANENGILCERDVKMTQVVAEFEEENRRLKESLDQACEHMSTQEDTINDLIEETEKLQYKIETLERALNAIQSLEEE